MPAVSKRQACKVLEDAGYRVLSIEQRRHYHVTVERDSRSVTVVMSVTPKSSHWPTWLLADVRRAMRQED